MGLFPEPDGEKAGQQKYSDRKVYEYRMEVANEVSNG